jgi:ElaB/YqjD/DUF883 family membrane-anchored ribosome-binding protein
MSTTNPETPIKRSPSTESGDTEDLVSQIETIRTDLQNLTSTVGRLVTDQMSRAQERAMDTVRDGEEAIRRNPLPAVAIAIGLGFLLGVFTRR